MIDPQTVFTTITAEYPAPIWFVPFLILIVLLFLSVFDAFTGRVPDVPVFVTFVGGVLSLAAYAGWMQAGKAFAVAAAAVIVLRLVNHAYYSMANHDAFGFGDAKWTGLAALGFGYQPVIVAWVVGAWLGLLWIYGCKLVNKLCPTYAGHDSVHFSPFLFIGLLVGFVWL